MNSDRADDYVGYERLDHAQKLFNGGADDMIQKAIALTLIDIAYSLKGIRQDRDRMIQQQRTL